MLPNQITLQTFTQAGKGGYKAVEVDAFIQRVYQNYNKLYNDNKALCEKLDETLPMIEEYNKSKSSIADALIWAKATAEKNIEEAQAEADSIVAVAKEKAEKLFNDKKAEAEAYYTEKTASADEKAKKAQAELDSIMAQSDSYAEEYTARINAQTQALIEQANLKAASIVADAYADAKQAREKADSIIAEANKELNNLKAESSKIKNEILSLISLAQKAADKIESRVFEPVEQNESTASEEVDAPVLFADEIENFSLDGIEPVVEEEKKPDTISGATEADHIRLFGAETPDVNKILSGIFTAMAEENGIKQPEDEENSFRFTNIFADPSDRGDTKRFNPLMKDSD